MVQFFSQGEHQLFLLLCLNLLHLHFLFFLSDYDKVFDRIFHISIKKNVILLLLLLLLLLVFSLKFCDENLYLNQHHRCMNKLQLSFISDVIFHSNSKNQMHWSCCVSIQPHGGSKQSRLPLLVTVLNNYTSMLWVTEITFINNINNYTSW